MRLENEFTVPVPVTEAWKLLLDAGRIAPCMPGATVERVEGDEIAGRVKVKVGPVMLSYAGTARFVEKDENAPRVVVEAKGRETRGSGTASATIEIRMQDEGSSTRVYVGTDLDVTGRPAQFGRGVMNDVAERLAGQFASCLAELVHPSTAAEPSARGPEKAGAVSSDVAAGLVRPATAPQAAIDLVGALGWPVAKRVAPAVAGLVLGLLLGSLAGRRGRVVIVVTPAMRQIRGALTT